MTQFWYQHCSLLLKKLDLSRGLNCQIVASLAFVLCIFICTYICKICLEFIDVGKPKQALDALYDVIKSKRHRTWQKIHEPIMDKYLELCVDLKKSHVAKEGLYQYKNICQQVIQV